MKGYQSTRQWASSRTILLDAERNLVQVSATTILLRGGLLLRRPGARVIRLSTRRKATSNLVSGAFTPCVRNVQMWQAEPSCSGRISLVFHLNMTLLFS